MNAEKVLSCAIKCMERAGECDGDCKNCPLAKDRESILLAYKQAVNALRKIRKIKRVCRKITIGAFAFCFASGMFLLSAIEGSTAKWVPFMALTSLVCSVVLANVGERLNG